jgi:hypothetical protein
MARPNSDKLGFGRDVFILANPHADEPDDGDKMRMGVILTAMAAAGSSTSTPAICRRSAKMSALDNCRNSAISFRFDPLATAGSRLRVAGLSPHWSAL